MASTAVGFVGAPRPGRVRAYLNRMRDGDEIAHLITLMFASAIFLITALLVYELYRNSGLARGKFGWGFLTGTTWDPVFEEFGALPFVFGTVVTSAVGMVVAIPLGVGAAIFL
ncbi:MAG: phosphate ABC transporter permease subunit PstC, partial [Acidobacteria bacterium]|nr:phosphate ABC transporter permease subunit PstC [Acidobacteriota bacterium]